MLEEVSYKCYPLGHSFVLENLSAYRACRFMYSKPLRVITELDNRGKGLKLPSACVFKCVFVKLRIPLTSIGMNYDKTTGGLYTYK